jgi:DNA-binding NarL/FixJ family response regulator
MYSIATTVFELPASITTATSRWKCVTDRSALWESLVAGAWSVLAEFDDDACLYLVVRGNSPQARLERALTERERQVLERVALGQANKFVAYELALPQSCVSLSLKEACSKAGLRSRTELLQLMPVASNDAVDAQPKGFCVPVDESVVLRVERRAVAVPDALTTSEGHIFRAILAGLSNAEIAVRRGRSLRTIANQVASVFRKLRISARAELVAQHRVFSDIFQQEIEPAPKPCPLVWTTERPLARSDVAPINSRFALDTAPCWPKHHVGL